MADGLELQKIEFEIVGNCDEASKSIKTLTTRLEKLQKIGNEGLHLDNVIAELQKLNDSVKLSGQLVSTLGRIAMVTKSLNKAAARTKIAMDSMNVAMNRAGKTADRTGDSIKKGASAMAKMEKSSTTMGRFSTFIANGFRKMLTPLKKATERMAQFGASIKRIAMYRMIRFIISSITTAAKEGIGNLYQWSKAINESFSQAMDRWATSKLYLKNSIGAMLGQLIESLIPILDVLIDKLILAINWVNQFFAAFSGKSYYRKAVKVTTEFAESVDKAGKAMKGMLLGFDKLNNLTSNDGGAGSSAPDFKDMFDKEEIDEAFWWVKELRSKIDGIGKSISEFRTKLGRELTAIKLVLDAGEFALGAVLFFFGARILGLALMIDGARRFTKNFKIANTDFKGDIQKQIFAIEGILGTGLMAVGAILAFSGANIPLGLGLIASGALLLGHSVIALSWNGLSVKTQKKIAEVEAYASMALLGLGAVLAFSGVNIPLGIGLMAAGALAMYHSTKVGWNILDKKVQEKITLIETIVGGASLVLGAVLAFSGVNIPLGIGLMAVGAAMSIHAAKVGWNVLDKNIQDKVNLIRNIVGGAFLVLGAVLAFSGVALPLGLALMAAGGAQLGVSASKINWDGIKENLMGAFGRIKNWWNENVSPWIKKAKDSISSLFESDTVSTIKSNGKGGSSGTFASGGFPTTGQYFIARERGPELVGTIGNRTAVVNNDQIVASVSDGVYEGVYAAMMAAGRDSQGTVNVILQGDAKNLFRVVREEDKRYTQQNGHSAFAYSH